MSLDILQGRSHDTIGQRVDLAKGQCSGFDALRLSLSVMVILWHTVVSTYGPATERIVLESVGRVGVHLILPVFFALSGFLVSGSLVRSRSLVGFVTLRALRIVPALSVEVVLCALLLGPLVTVLPLGEYFAGESFAAYFLNVLGLIHFQLPGVFLDNPMEGIVNLSLWTVPYELECYLVLCVLAMLGLARRPLLLGMLVALASVALSVLHYFRDVQIVWATQPPGRLLVLAFVAGVVLYNMRHSIPRRIELFVGSLLLAMVLLYHPLTSFMAALPAAYATVYLGTMQVPRKYLPKGDYSYGMYLYAFPMQQLYVHLFMGNPQWAASIAFSVTASFICAFISWHLIEKRVLAQRGAVVRATQSAWDRGLAGLAVAFRPINRIWGNRQASTPIVPRQFEG